MFFLRHALFFQFIAPFILLLPFIIMSEMAGVSELPMLIIYLALMVIVGMTLNSYYRMKSRQTMEFLLERCDPEAFLGANDILLRICRNKNMRQSLLINKSSGLLANGDAQGALEVLSGVDPENAKLNLMLKILCYIYYSSCQLELGDRENAETGLRKARELLYGAGMPPHYEQLFEDTYRLVSIESNLLSEIYGGIESFLTEYFDRAVTKKEKVTAKYLLGRLFIAQGRADEAKEALMFVEDNGNKLIIKERAVLQLRSIG
jgi:hypothetical protein